VIPGIKDGTLLFVLDVDDLEYAAFDETDKTYLQIIANKIVYSLY
jgi:putative methionine-R-sulfoxide reductase with GAF domain